MIKKIVNYFFRKEKKQKIYIKEVKPEMTQCRIIQIDKRKIK